jgi:hypothetical protein
LTGSDIDLATSGLQSVSSDVATQGSPQLPQQAGPNVPPVPVNMQANNGIVQGSGAHGRPPQVPQQQVPPEVVAKLLANARQNPSAMNSLTQMIAAQGGHAGFPAGTTAAQQRDALMRFAQQARGGQQGQGGPAAAAQLVAQTQRMMQAQQQQALGNGGSPVQAQPNQNGNLPGPRPAQQGVQSQPLQVQASGQNNNTGNINTVNNNNQGANQANGNAAAGRAPPPGPIAMPPQAGQARPSGPGAVPLPTQVNTAQRPNLNKQALDQQLTNILSNLDFFIQKKENNQLTMDETKMVRYLAATFLIAVTDRKCFIWLAQSGIGFERPGIHLSAATTTAAASQSAATATAAAATTTTTATANQSATTTAANTSKSRSAIPASESQ